jgi:hypothetical protein
MNEHFKLVWTFLIFSCNVHAPVCRTGVWVSNLESDLPCEVYRYAFCLNHRLRINYQNCWYSSVPTPFPRAPQIQRFGFCLARLAPGRQLMKSPYCSCSGTHLASVSTRHTSPRGKLTYNERRHLAIYGLNRRCVLLLVK